MTENQGDRRQGTTEGNRRRERAASRVLFAQHVYLIYLAYTCPGWRRFFLARPAAKYDGHRAPRRPPSAARNTSHPRRAKLLGIARSRAARNIFACSSFSAFLFTLQLGNLWFPECRDPLLLGTRREFAGYSARLDSTRLDSGNLVEALFVPGPRERGGREKKKERPVSRPAARRDLASTREPRSARVHRRRGRRR